MSADSSNQAVLCCSAARAAPAALEWRATSSLARPYHVFQDVCNLINADGGVLSLMLEPAEMNPLALEIACRNRNVDLTNHIQIDSNVYCVGDLLHVGTIVVHWEPHFSWNPSPVWTRVRTNLHETRAMVEIITTQLITERSQDSLAVLLSSSGIASESRVSGWQKRAWKPITELLDGLGTLNPNTMSAGAIELAGLGIGLTPSGDDFIIGVMHAIWCAIDPVRALDLCDGLLGATTNRTNALSASYMARAARGEASQAWHSLIEAIANGVSVKKIPSVESLLKLGHTSGQDALSGFLLGLRYIQLS